MNAVYAGSFDCYTNGHHDIVKKASAIFDELHIVIAVNSTKKRRFPVYGMHETIMEALNEDGILNCKVVVYDGPIADYCEQNSIRYLVRGLRNFTDYGYEEQIAIANKLLSPGIETIYFRASDAAISSSLVSEFIRYNKDISPYVPRAVAEFIKNSK